MNIRQRLDQRLVELGLAESRQKAQAMILAGTVLVNEQRAEKAGQNVRPDAVIRIKGETLRYVGRGGLKLEGALRDFAISVENAICLDVGASTGGFTDCLLQHGAARVYAVDVGHNQLVWKLRTDERVISREGVNARFLAPTDFPEPFDFITGDVSFISMTMILPALGPLAKPGARLVILVKPQFEVGREDVGKGGIVRDPALHRRAAERVIAAARATGFRPERLVRSPIEGADGNVEFLLSAIRVIDADAAPAPELAADLTALFGSASV